MNPDMLSQAARALSGGMSWERYLSVLVLVLVRVSAVMVFAPFFSSAVIAARIKAAFAFAVAVLLAPVVAGFPASAARLDAGAVLGELAVGLVFGVSLCLFQELCLFAGQLIGVQFSLSLVNLLDPNSMVQTPLLGQLFSSFGVLVLLTSGLHRTLLAAFLRTFVDAPAGSVWLPGRSAPALLAMTGGIFVAALQLAAPVLAATILVELAIALLGRISPQMPVMALTVPAKTLVGYVVLIGSLALWPHFLEARFAELLQAAIGLVRHSG